MADVALQVTEVDLKWSAVSKKVHKFNAKLNGILIRDIKYFPGSEGTGIQLPGIEFINRKTKKGDYWRHVVLSKDECELLAKKFRSFLKKTDEVEDDDE
jgi:hypothetical protein